MNLFVNSKYLVEMQQWCNEMQGTNGSRIFDVSDWLVFKANQKFSNSCSTSGQTIRIGDGAIYGVVNTLDGMCSTLLLHSYNFLSLRSFETLIEIASYIAHLGGYTKLMLTGNSSLEGINTGGAFDTIGVKEIVQFRNRRTSRQVYFYMKDIA